MNTREEKGIPHDNKTKMTTDTIKAERWMEIVWFIMSSNVCDDSDGFDE